MEQALAIVEIAGRDSVAAAVAAVRRHGFRELVPTIAYTGTEIGDREAPVRAISTLRTLVAGEAIVHDAVPLAHPALWAAMNARPAAELQRRYGLSSPCLACHLYLHLLRIPLAWSHGNAPVVSGERDTHDGRIKLSQTPAGIDAAIRVLRYGDVELLQPIRSASGDEVAELVGSDWKAGSQQLRCLLSGNYVLLDGTVEYDKTRHERYLAEYFEPVGRAVIDAWRAESAGAPAADFDAVVRAVLQA